MKLGVIFFTGLLIGCTDQRSEPKLVDAASVAPSIAFDIRYAGPNNFVGKRIDGYEAAKCWLTPQAAEALGRVQRDLEARDVGLLVYDCYRPQRAVDHFVRWCEDLSDQRNKARFYPSVDKSELLDRGYIARKSSHSRGSTVDLTLIHRIRSDQGKPLDMGTEFDLFDAASHTDATNITEAQRANRQLLTAAMKREGFKNLPVEWWHYTLRYEPYPDMYLDIVIR